MQAINLKKFINQISLYITVFLVGFVILASSLVMHPPVHHLYHENMNSMSLPAEEHGCGYSYCTFGLVINQAMLINIVMGQVPIVSIIPIIVLMLLAYSIKNHNQIILNYIKLIRDRYGGFGFFVDIIKAFTSTIVYSSKISNYHIA